MGRTFTGQVLLVGRQRGWAAACQASGCFLQEGRTALSYLTGAWWHGILKQPKCETIALIVLKPHIGLLANRVVRLVGALVRIVELGPVLGPRFGQPDLG